MVTATTCLTPTHNSIHRPAPLTETGCEIKVRQYGPAWVALVSRGCNVRNGNIVDVSPLRSNSLPAEVLLDGEWVA